MRYLSHTDDDIKTMLNQIGKESLEELFSSIPGEFRVDGELKLPNALTEWELKEYFENISKKGFTGKSFLGGGSYEHYIPEIINYLTSRSEFLTSYTPYQPEISQGTLQYLFEFQTYIANYLGMDYSNSSMYDGATSFVEAVLLSLRVNKKNRVVVSKAINPNYLEVLKTYRDAVGFEIIELDYGQDGRTNLSSIPDLDDIASIAIQSPNFFGIVENLERVRQIVLGKKALYIALFSEILSFGLYRPPGDYGADIACGEAQSFGLYRNFGGPYLGVFAFKKKYLRSVPGRIVGQTVDRKGRRSFCLTLATREQHIRRERATSNICSNQGINTLRALIYMSLLGGKGLKRLAKINYNNCEYLKESLKSIGCTIKFASETFNEFVVKYPKGFNIDGVKRAGYLPGIPLFDYFEELRGYYLITVTEVFTRADIDNYIDTVGGQDDLC